jgi:hypothetical protein
MKFWMFCLVNHPFSLIVGSAPGSFGTIDCSAPGVAAPSFSVLLVLPDLAPCDFASSASSAAFFLASSSAALSAFFDLLLLLDFLDFVDLDVSYLLKFFSSKESVMIS